MRNWMCGLAGLAVSGALLLTGCGGGSAPATQQAEGKNADKSAEKVSGEITVWTFADWTIKPWVPGFEKKYPDVKVNLVNIPDLDAKLKTVLAAGSGAPDVVMIERGMMKHYSSIEGLEDLLQLPYDAGRYKNDFSPANWSRWLSLDGKKLLGFPWDMPPAVTFYRADIMDENGFPSDPEQLAKYMEDPNNVLNMAQTLKAKGIYMFEWNTTPLDLYTQGLGLFDRDLKWQRNNEKFIKGLDLAKQAKQLGIAFNKRFEKQDKNTGKVAMFYSGAWALDGLKKDAPDTAGKWRVTRLPFNSYGGNGGSTLAIPTQSKNKKAAWAFIQYGLATQEGQDEDIKVHVMPGWKPAQKSDLYSKTKEDFLGGQAANALFAELNDKVQPEVGTPLDDKAGKIWSQEINDAINKNQDSAAALAQIQDDVLKAIASDRDQLLQQLGKK